MAAQDETPIQLAEAAGPLVPNGQTISIEAGNAPLDRDDRRGRKDSLAARLLDNLRIALSAPHI
jgi:hypothetical protein